MGGGGGASPQIPQLNTRDVQPWYDFQLNQFGQYNESQPLLSSAQADAISYANELPSRTGRLRALGDANQQALQGYSDRFNTAAANEQGIVDSGGQASAQELRNVDQGTLTGMSDTHSLGAQGTQLLNRDQYTLGRKYQALSSLEGITGLQSGLQNQILLNQSGVLGQEQSMQTNSLNQRTGVQGAETGTFTQLMSPILQIPLANEQARIAEAQIAEQANQTAASSKGGTTSALGSLGGAAIGAVGIAL